MGFFDWVTRGVRTAVLRGVEEAAHVLNEADENGEAVLLRLPVVRLVAIEHNEAPAATRKRATAKK